MLTFVEKLLDELALLVEPFDLAARFHAGERHARDAVAGEIARAQYSVRFGEMRDFVDLAAAHAGIM